MHILSHASFFERGRYVIGSLVGVYYKRELEAFKRSRAIMQRCRSAEI